MGHTHWDNIHSPFPLPKVPDYRIYKVEDVPCLSRTQRLLAKEGLKDPWLRNEVWKYSHPLAKDPLAGIKWVTFCGFKYGFGAFVLTVFAEKVYHHFYPRKEHVSYRYKH